MDSAVKQRQQEEVAKIARCPSVSMGDTSHQRADHRRLVIPAKEGGRRQAIYCLRDDLYDKLDIPLGLTETQPAQGEARSKGAGECPNIIVPLLPLCHTTPERDLEKALPPSSGYLYIFVDGHLWREVQVLSRGFYKDVNLRFEAGRDQRVPTGQPDNRLVVPHHIDGTKRVVEIAYSHVQWSWDRINAMGGMEPKDPRITHLQPPMPSDEQKAEADALRSARLQHIDLRGYPSFPLQAAEGRTAAIDNIANVPEELNCLLAGAFNTGLPVVYLEDPLGVAKNQRLLNFEDIDLLATVTLSKQNGEHELGALLQDLLQTEDKQLAASDEKPERTLGALVDRERLTATVSGWDALTDEAADELEECETALVALLEQELESGSLEAVLGDYLSDPCPERRAAGVVEWLSLVCDMQTEAGRRLAKHILDGAYPALAPLFAPDEALREALMRMERGESGKPEEAPLFQWAGGLPGTRHAKGYGTGVITAGAEVVAMAGLLDGDEAGAEALLAYLGQFVKFGAAIKDVPLAYFQEQRTAQAAAGYVYRPIPSTNAGARTLRQIVFPEVTRKTAAQLMETPLARNGLVGPLAVLETLNLGLAFKAAFNENATAEDVVQFGGAVASAAGLVGELLKPGADVAESRARVFRENAKRRFDNRNAELRQIRADMDNQRAGRRTRRVRKQIRNLEARARAAEPRVRDAARRGVRAEAGYRAAGRVSGLVGALRWGGIVAAVAGVGLSGWGLYKRSGGGNTEAIRGAQVAVGGSALALIGTAVVFANAWNPVGWTLIIGGSAAAWWGDSRMRRADYTPWERLVAYGYFGIHRYQKEYTAPEPAPEFPEPVSEEDGVELYIIDLSEELKEAYQLMYAYSAEVQVLEEINLQPGPLPRGVREIPLSLGQRATRTLLPTPGSGPLHRVPTGHRIVRVDVRFSHFQPFEFAFDCEVEVDGVRFLGRKDPPTTHGPERLLFREIEAEPGVLERLELYLRLPERAIPNAVTARTRLVIDQERGLTVPVKERWQEAGFDPGLIRRDRRGLMMASRYQRIEEHARYRNSLRNTEEPDAPSSR